MIRLGLRLAFTGGWGRPALLAACTAVVSGLLLVAVALLRVRGDGGEALWSVAADPGTRGGLAFAIILLGLPPLLLLYQAVRLGTAARERRLAALRLAGATPGEVRVIGAVEVGVPALLGSTLGIGVYLLLRATLGGSTYRGAGWHGDGVIVSTRNLDLVPSVTMPTWWQYVAVVTGVAAAGIAVGLLAGRGVVASPLGVTRRAPRPAPRPWGLLLIVAGLAIGAGLVRFFDSVDSQVWGSAAVGCILLGAMSLSSWAAGAIGRFVAARASSAHVLLAARRLATDPRASGRAAAAVGGIALVAGGAAAFLADVMDNASENGYSVWAEDREQVLPVLVVLAVLVVALVVVVGSLAVHLVESYVESRRSLAALAATGVPAPILARAQRWQAGLVSMPTTVVGVLAGAALYGVGGGLDPLLLPLTLVVLVGDVLLVGLAIRVAVGLTRPWLRRATDAGNLRTE